jgi:hypothetical protein
MALGFSHLVVYFCVIYIELLSCIAMLCRDAVEYGREGEYERNDGLDAIIENSIP